MADKRVDASLRFRLRNAVEDMASGSKPVRKRLRSALQDYLAPLQPGDFFVPLRAEWEWISDQLSELDSLADEDLRELAKRIVRLCAAYENAIPAETKQPS